MTDQPGPSGRPAASDPPAPEPVGAQGPASAREPLDPAPASNEPAEPAAVLRAYELPTARRVVTTGLSLAYRASGELRRASIYIGLLSLALLGPPIVVLIEFLVRFQITDETSFLDIFGSGAPDPAIIGAIFILYGLGALAIAGWYAVSIDATLIAVSLLAARQSDRQFTLREATIRARQVFWRLVRGGLIVALVSVVLNLVLAAALSTFFTPGSTGVSFVVSFVVVVLLAPLGYLATGIVLGDVGAIEALKRSIRLARVRPRIALVVALFTLVTAAIQLFALGAGLDLFGRIADFVHLGLTGGFGPLVLVILGVLALVMALLPVMAGATPSETLVAMVKLAL